MTIQVATLTLHPPVFLAPLAGITDLPFRRIVQGFGAGLVVTLQNYLATSDFPVTIITGLVFMVCVLLFRRGIIGEFYASRIGRSLGFKAEN